MERRTESVLLNREYLSGGALRMSAADCIFTFNRPRAGALCVTISGHDDGQFGSSTLDELTLALRRERPLELFIDARDALGVAAQVSDAWTQFFSTNRADLTRVHVLVSSKIVQLTIAIAQHLSRTGNLIQIYSDPATFESLLNRSK